MKPMASVSLNLVQKISSLKKKWFSREDEELSSSQSNKSNNIFMEMQNILIWNDPFFSCCCIVAVNIVFWLIIYLDLRFYDIVFTTLLIVTCVQLWMELFSKYVYKNKSDSQNLLPDAPRTSDVRTLSSNELNNFFDKVRVMLKETYIKARFFRQSQPGMFCVVTCMGFLLLGFIGRSLSDVIVLYMLLMLVMTVPGIVVHFLPADVTKRLSAFFYSSRKESCSDDDEVEPYLPDTNEETLELLKLAGDIKLPSKENDDDSNDFLLDRLSERTSDTVESLSSKISLFPESVVMPSPENSMDLWEFDLPLEERTELNETESNSLNFHSKHFDGDSSEEEFIKGLGVQEETTNRNHKKEEAYENNPSLGTDNKISMGKFLEKEQKRKTTGSDKDSSSDTDSFELISEEDM